MPQPAILISGATGYVGGRLIPRLLESGYRVRALGRSMEKLACRPWAHHDRIELVRADVLDRTALTQAARGCRAAYYLVHSMIAQKSGYAEADRIGARNMVHAAAAEGLERIIYLGGLGEISNLRLSDHLRSRHEVADILQSGPVPATVLRAAMIIGSGSASFEMLRYLVERLPVMVTPRWVQTPVQPISVGDVLGYLLGCLEPEAVKGESLDIGGPDVLTYHELIDIFCEEARLPKRRIFPVPVLTPKLSAYWIHLVTPVPAAIAMPLTEGLGVPVICKDDRIRNIIPQRLTGCREAIRTALQRVAQCQIDTCWSDAGDLTPPEWAYCGDAAYAGGTILECGYRIRLRATPDDVWRPVSRIGGSTGWYRGNVLWELRGWLDKMVGGIGLQRGRRDPENIRVGDALDFWRVLAADPPHRLHLVSEMKLPGEAMLQIDVTPFGSHQTEVQLLSRFLPKGLIGLIYWYATYPFHQWIFSGMLKAIARSIGKPILKHPERFTPKVHQTCTVPGSKT
ncbi:Putative nucleoside-diphosphate-sugar epimerase [Olavius algarvensis associated proteobacterium Delta 3]|nr:Putative nucleoside-diphosphate-sugar epimerase [Olavius algarvensis associated proteobacterium Delta 3]